MLYKKIFALILTCGIAISVSSCNKSNSNSAQSQTSSKVVSQNVSSGKVELKSYDFPKFLTNIKKPDVLSNVIYSSFDTSSYVSNVEKQPFDDYECLQMINKLFYTFKENDYVGLLDKDGNVLVQADTYVSIVAGSWNLLVMSRETKLNAPDEYISFDDDGNIIMLDGYSFEEDDIQINIISDAESDSSSDGSVQYEMVLSNDLIVIDANGGGNWDSIEKLDMDNIDTTKVYSAYYKFTRENEFYYVCIDKYSNYTIYGGAYAYVKLKVGNVYGECYLLSYNDYNELNKMIESFGRVNSTSIPSNDDTLDFIQITFGLNSDNSTQITVSSDGFCLTDSITADDKQKNTYFSCLDKESFVSLVLWVDQVLSEEYTK